jgi:hypothetical protein
VKEQLLLILKIFYSSLLQLLFGEVVFGSSLMGFEEYVWEAIEVNWT